ncbi:flavin reductase [Plantactinospora sp. B6F1]|uniref:flavin reductase n=1 Tax=Plantactinospora sp. B6F1 TaxID=3158971 RepID=UPI0032D99FFD
MYGPHARFRPHTPARPSFRCRTCGAHWPCQPARLGLLWTYRHDRIGLLVYLAAQLQHALQDLPGAEPRELAARFLHWLPRTPPC